MATGGGAEAEPFCPADIFRRMIEEHVPIDDWDIAPAPEPCTEEQLDLMEMPPADSGARSGWRWAPARGR